MKSVAVACVAMACAGAWAAEKATPASPVVQAFIRALNASDSTEETRRAAWREVEGTYKTIPQAAVDAIDKARKWGWGTLAKGMSSGELRFAVSGLSAASQACKGKVAEAVAAKGRVGGIGSLDAAMAPIDKALAAAMDAVKAAPKMAEARAYTNEVEHYAKRTPLRTGWSQDLEDAIIAEMFAARAAATAAGLQTIEANKKTGAMIDPEEYACIVRLNTHRMLVGLDPVEIDLRLVVAAKKHSEEMVAKKYVSDESPTETLKTPSQRAAREMTSCTDECVASGAMSGVGAFKIWYYTRGQYEILTSSATTAGAGYCKDKWTLMMGTAKMSAAAAKMTQYVRDRYRAGDRPAAWLELGKWCVKEKLVPQAEDELGRVLEVDPKNAAAKKALEELHAPKKK